MDGKPGRRGLYLAEGFEAKHSFKNVGRHFHHVCIRGLVGLPSVVIHDRGGAGLVSCGKRRIIRGSFHVFLVFFKRIRFANRTCIRHLVLDWTCDAMVSGPRSFDVAFVL